MGADYYLAFTTGLLGGFGHCIGMCGPIVASLAWGRSEGGRAAQGGLWQQLQYHAGRILTYMLAGGAMGMAGSFVNVAGRGAGIQNSVALCAGIAMVLMGGSIAGIWRGVSYLEGRVGPVLSMAHSVLVKATPFRYFALGLVLGLLPCGLSYSVFIASAGTGGALPGAAVAALFGLGTLPAVLLFSALVASLSAMLRGWLYRAGGVVIMAMGILFILRGVRHYAGL